MSTRKSRTPSGGLGLADALTVLFTGLKLTGHIDWPWRKVLWLLWLKVALLTALPFLERAAEKQKVKDLLSGESSTASASEVREQALKISRAREAAGQEAGR